MDGFVHSIETFATADGPGSRCVVFCQGCGFRCLYCHNPDTWACKCGQKMTAMQVAAKVMRYKPYYGTKGGLTLSGGEPLIQPEFAAEVFRLCREGGVHTALDTAGREPDEAVKKVLQYTSLVLLDIKHCDPAKFKYLTGCEIDGTLNFLEYITAAGIKFWVRQVIVPGLNDNPQDIDSLAAMLKDRAGLERVELLPYHTLGVEKYSRLGLVYKLKDLSPVSEQTIAQLTQRLRKQGLTTA